MWKWQKRVIDLSARRRVCLSFFCSLFRFFFWLDCQAAAPIPQSQKLSYSPNRLKSHPCLVFNYPILVDFINMSATIAPSKLTKEPGLGITYSNGYGHGVFLYLSFRMFSFDLFSGVDQPQCENDHQKIMNGTTGWTRRSVTLITIIQRVCLLHRCQLI
jgi:hypothetical protein